MFNSIDQRRLTTDSKARYSFALAQNGVRSIFSKDALYFAFVANVLPSMPFFVLAYYVCVPRLLVILLYFLLAVISMSRLLGDYPDTQAVICVSDLSAFGALTECARKGVKVPDDIAVAGFGAYDISSVCVPTLTTIDPHPAEIGRKTGELIVSLLRSDRGKENGPIRLKIGPQLSVGGSSN